MPGQRSKCHALLHTRGLQHFDAGDDAAAIAMLRPAMFYACDVAAQAKTARLLAACCLRSGQAQLALDYLERGHQQEPGSTATSALQVQALLALGRQAEAAAEVEQLGRQGAVDALKVGRQVDRHRVLRAGGWTQVAPLVRLPSFMAGLCNPVS